MSDSELVKVELPWKLENETGVPEGVVIDCEPLSDGVIPAALVDVEFVTGKGAELSLVEGEKPDEAADNVLDAPCETEEVVSDPGNRLVCVETRPAVVEFTNPDDPEPVKVPLND